MHIYFVRHGETVSNKAEVHQTDEEELTPLGYKQAEYLAQSLHRFPIETIISSPLKRAKDTAEIIQKSLNKPLNFVPELREIPYPTEIHGLKYTHPEAIRVRSEVAQNADNSDWHYSDEENFSETKVRSKKFLSHLNTVSEKYVLAVTHGRFLRVLVAYMLYDGNLSAEKYFPIANFFETTNTGITIIEKLGDNYRLLTWNDYAHLSEFEAG